MHPRLLIVALLTLAIGDVTSAVAADGAAVVAGRWSGPLETESGGVSSLGKSLTLVVAPDGDGFHVTVTSGQAFFDAGLVPDGHPGVYEAPTRGSGSIFSLFTSSRVADPLTGAPLIWARTTPDGIVVYRLDLDSGAFHLDRTRRRPQR